MATSKRGDAPRRRAHRNPSIEAGQAWRQKNTGEIVGVTDATPFHVHFASSAGEKRVPRVLFEKAFEIVTASHATSKEHAISDERKALLATSRRHERDFSARIDEIKSLPKASSTKARDQRKRELGAYEEGLAIEGVVRDVIDDTKIGDREAEERVKGLWMRSHNLRWAFRSTT